MKSEPIAAATVFRAVMTAAAWRCQCTGVCGQPHAKSDGRCPREHDGYADKHGGPIRLLAAPADPHTPEREAVALPARALRAWCPGCHAAARKPAPAPDALQGGLFDL
ncbi:hypothetical protein [Streptomyces sp. NRRL S-337]|uniref:hypothetical protein n=1 Tax=Streptomyces sp. NRRL S-337 TaxID=1463900 RepID=UPI0004C97839|nr:hypothetical protein [Streptomyces sp. NRRL S-337]